MDPQELFKKLYGEPAGGKKHYYGDIVRSLFIIGGVVILLSLPFFNDVSPFPRWFGICIVLFIALIAGLTNPQQLWVATLDWSISAAAFLIFEFVTINYISDHIAYGLVNQLLAIIFFVALYYSTKTIRGFYLPHKDDLNE